MTNTKNLFKRYVQAKTTKKIPVADISHHRSKSDIKPKKPPKQKPINEGRVEDWVKDEEADMEKDYHNENTAKSHVRALDRNGYRAVDAYITGGLEDGDDTGSKRVNTHLIECHNSGKEPNKHFTFGDGEDGEIKHLDLNHLDASIKAQKHETPITTYSGLGFNPSKVADSEGNLHLPAYTSSTTDRRVAHNYANIGKINKEAHILKIEHQKGSSGLYLGNDEDVTPFGQSEHISPRNMKVKIDPTPETHTNKAGVKFHIWSAKRMTK